MAHPLRGLAPSRHNRFAGLRREILLRVNFYLFVGVQSLSRLRRQLPLHKGAKDCEIYLSNLRVNLYFGAP